MFKWRRRSGVKAAEYTATDEDICNVENNDEISLLKHNQKCIVNRINEKIEETGFIAENAITLTHDISNNVEIQMESIEKVVSEISNYTALAEEVLSSTENSKVIAQETMDIAKKGNDAVDDSIQAMSEIEISVENAKKVVNDLSIKSAHINEMLKIIKDIADHTNLLSLNASIEAARAGEAGRGFGVVAKEVKNLAQRSVESAGQISNTIREINESIGESIAAMDESMKKVLEGNEIAKNTKDVFNNIIGAVGTTSNVAEEINMVVSRQMEGLDRIIVSTEEMNKTSENVMTMVETASLNTQYTKTSLRLLSEVSKDLQSISTKLLDKIEGTMKNESLLKTYLSTAPLEYDPQLVIDTQSAQIAYNIHAGLLLISSTGEITAGIAKSWYVEEDNLTWVFNLRKGTKFHNGKEITPQDIKYSYERLLSPSLKSPNTWLLEQVEGAKGYNEGKEKEVTGIKIIDQYRISIKLIGPYSGFLLNLGQCVCAILSKEDGQKGKITGCGPYRIENKDDEKCILIAFKDYFAGTPYIDKIIVNYDGTKAVNSFIHKECDFITIDNEKQIKELSQENIPNINYKSIMGTYYAGFNLRSNSIFAKDHEIRKACNLAVNKEKIIHEILGGLGEEAKGPIPSSMMENNYLSGVGYNPRGAKDIFNKKGSLIGSTKLKVLIRDESCDSIYNRIAQFIINDLKEVGIECIVETVHPDNYVDTDVLNRCDLFVDRWIADTGDMDNFLEPLFNPSNITDFTGYNNLKVTEMMNKAKEIINPKKRNQMYKDIQKIIIEDMPWISLYYPQFGYVSREGIIGVRISPLGIIKYEDIIIEKN
ncbi:MAG: ABC transporter substrate-binding protein [Marinisporobacter sp.]|nr:ABC transporter substrate-binding protein [Marinisporobacter sp.]